MRLKGVFIILGMILAPALVHGQLQDGQIVENFTLQKHGSDEEISLYDYEDYVIVLDFFAYWCGPCQTSSPELEEGVAQYYKEQGATENGAKVVMIAVSIDNNNTGAVNSFVQNAGLELVGLDTNGAAWRQFGQGYVPHFAVVNGVANSNYEQWEVIHTNYGYRGANFYRNQAESVVPAEDSSDPSAYETWAAENVSNASERGADADPDGDGYSNLYEFACGSDPSDHRSGFPIGCSRSESGEYSFRYARSKSAEGVNSAVQVSSNLGDWSDISTVSVAENETDMGDYWEVEVLVPEEALDQLFVRRMVSLPGSL